VGASSTGGGVGELRLDAELIPLPTWGKDNTSYSGLYLDTAMTELVLASGLGKNGLQYLTFTAKAALAGVALHHMQAGKGYTFYVGAATQYDHLQNRTLGGPQQPNLDDFFGICHVLGPTVDITLYYGAFRLRATLDLFYDFAMVRSFAFEPYRDRHGLAGARSVLARKAYSYSNGATTQSRIVIQGGPLELGAQAQISMYESINLFDPAAEEVTDNFSVYDQLKSVRAYSMVKLPAHFTAELVMQATQRKGQIKDVSRSATELRITGGLGYEF